MTLAVRQPRVFKNPLAYPQGIAPGFDPTHIAAQGFFAVPQNATFVSTPNAAALYTPTSGKGNLWSTAGTAPTFTMDGSLGPCSAFVGGNNQYRLTITTFTPTACTLACIIRVISQSSANFMSDSIAANTGYQLQTTGNLRLSCGTGGSATSSANTISNGGIYFLAASTNNSVTNLVILNLATGQLGASIVTAALTPGATGTLMNVGFNGAVAMNFAAGLINHSFISMPALLQWASDPWSFWYPQSSNLGVFAKGSVVAAIANKGAASLMMGI